MKSYLKSRKEDIKKARKDAGNPPPSEFSKLITAYDVDKGTPPLKDPSLPKRKLRDFEKSISFHFTKGIPYSALHCILALPEMSICLGDDTPPFPAVCANAKTFQNVLLSILSDYGFLFAEARPTAAGQVSPTDANVCTNEQFDHMHNAETDESEIISEIYQKFQEFYCDYEKNFKMTSKKSVILERLAKIADPNRPDWFQRLLRQIFQARNKSLPDAKIDCVKEALERGLLTEEKLNKCFYWPEINGINVKDDHGRYSQYTLKKALADLSNICNNYIADRNECLSILQNINVISTEANNRYKQFLKTMKKLKKEFQDDPFLVCNSNYLTAVILKKLKIYFYDRRKKKASLIQIDRLSSQHIFSLIG